MLCRSQATRATHDAVVCCGSHKVRIRFSYRAWDFVGTKCKTCGTKLAVVITPAGWLKAFLVWKWDGAKWYLPGTGYEVGQEPGEKGWYCRASGVLFDKAEDLHTAFSRCN